MKSTQAYLLILALVFGFNVISQESILPVVDAAVSSQDSLKKSNIRDPKKAAIMSAILPGLGQIYNRKYWKLPIVYGGVGASAYFIGFNRSQYKLFKKYYIWDTDATNPLKSPYYQNVQPQALRQQADQYRSWMEYSYIAFVAIYLLQIVDASVDAHLSGFDVSDDLSLNIHPSVQFAHGLVPVNSFAITLKF